MEVFDSVTPFATCPVAGIARALTGVSVAYVVLAERSDRSTTDRVFGLSDPGVADDPLPTSIVVTRLRRGDKLVGRCELEKRLPEPLVVRLDANLPGDLKAYRYWLQVFRSLPNT